MSTAYLVNIVVNSHIAIKKVQMDCEIYLVRYHK